MNDLVGPITPIPFDLYCDIHKAIRVAMFDVTAAAGRLDPADRGARLAHADQVRDLLWLLRFHADHEDTHIEAAVAAVMPLRAREIATEHAALEVRMDRLVAIAELVFDEDRDDAAGAVHLLYLELASFVSAYLAHQDMEERIVMPSLWESYDLQTLLEIHSAILASIAPDVMARCLALMLPAMNNDGRAAMLAAMQADAPPEAFAAVCALASEVLTNADFVKVSDRIGRSPAPVG